ncbi:hypothetical protein GARY_16 [Vibrio phage Gary]|uniref:Uncharacterized protein n=1 Tax=Vibrio phage Gary TaxID=2801534 RepID=A0A7U0J4I8_9CAUD|nr:hypothetical protein KNV71_gp016 [Vibrio phage Gary]QQV88120.1 hypothetical protein GARY_16 [Vibrio phage Gary]
MRMITVLNKGGGNETCSHLRWGLHPLPRNYFGFFEKPLRCYYKIKFFEFFKIK